MPKMNSQLERPLATPKQIAEARQLHGSDDINIDSDAKLSICEDGSYWIQAWVFMSKEEEPDAECSECGERFWSADGHPTLAICGECS